MWDVLAFQDIVIKANDVFLFVLVLHEFLFVFASVSNWGSSNLTQAEP